MSTVQLIDDDSPRLPSLADDSLSSPQSRRCWNEQGTSGPTALGHLKARRLSGEQPQKFVDTEVEPSGNGLELLGCFG